MAAIVYAGQPVGNGHLPDLVIQPSIFYDHGSLRDQLLHGVFVFGANEQPMVTGDDEYTFHFASP